MTDAMTDTATTVGGAAGTTPQGQLVAAHWGRLSLTFDGAVQALRAQGIEPELATADDLHAMDMNHMGGLAATDALAEMARLRPGQLVLDVGAEVGGPARRLARRHGARVCGVELSEPVFQAAVALTRPALLDVENGFFCCVSHRIPQCFCGGPFEHCLR